MKLLLVDDHPLFSVGFAHALAQARFDIETQTAPGIEAGLAAAAGLPELDIVLIDYRLADDDGLAGLRRFGARFPLVARVLISGQEDAALAARARAAGASAFLGKSLALDRVLQALQTVAEGGVHFGEATTGPGLSGPSHWPTARQMEVLALIAQGKQNKGIAHELGIAERTVKLHVTALFDTLKARNRTHLLVRAREVGLV